MVSPTDLAIVFLIEILIIILGVFILSAVCDLMESRFLRTNPWRRTVRSLSDMSSGLRFRLAFGFWPREKYNFPDFCQQVVDDEMRSRATAFLERCRQEEVLPKELAYIGSIADRRLPKERPEVERARRLVRQYKNLFWEAHRLAKHFGFKTRGTAKLYVALNYADVDEA